MFKKKEINMIFIAVVISAFIFAAHKEMKFFALSFFSGLLIFAIIIFTNTLVKKYSAKNFSIKIEYDLWKIQQTGFSEKSRLKNPFPIGLVLSFVLSIVSLGIIESYTFLQFNPENDKRRRILRKRGSYRKSEMNESDPAFTVAWGFYSLIILSFIAFLLSKIFSSVGLNLDFIFLELAKYSIIYSCWNMIPFGQLDGAKLFFGSILNWIILAVILIVSLMFVMVL